MLFTGSLINLIIIRYLCDVKNRLGIPSVTVAVILAVVLLNIVVFYYTPLYGDDLTYKSFFEGPSTRWTGPLGWLRWLWMHWNSINGRLGNFVIIPLLALPQGLRAVVAAGFLGLFFWAPCRLVARFTGRRAQVATMAMTALLVAGMPWYDSMCLFIGQTNYVWAGAFVIMALLLLMRRRPVRYRMAAALFCAVAGAFHEAAGLPVAVGLVVYNVLNRRRPTDRLLTAFFIAGALFATLAPGIIARAGNPREPDASPLMIALTSDWAVILMLGAAALTRQSGLRLRRSPLLILFVAAVVSGVISVLSTYEGRSGMFAQLFALTFLTAFYGARVRLSQWGGRLVIAAGIVLPLVVESVTALECRRLWPAHQRLLELYLASPDGSFVFEEATEPSPVAMLRPYPAPPLYDEALIPPLEHLYGKPPRIILKPCR